MATMMEVQHMNHRSRVSNGKAPYDMRSANGRRLRDLTEQYTREVADGLGLNAIRRAEIAKLAALQVMSEQLYAKLADEELTNKEMDRFTRITGAFGRLAKRLGLDKTEPDLFDGLDFTKDDALNGYLHMQRRADKAAPATATTSDDDDDDEDEDTDLDAADIEDTRPRRSSAIKRRRSR